MGITVCSCVLVLVWAPQHVHVCLCVGVCLCKHHSMLVCVCVGACVGTTVHSCVCVCVWKSGLVCHPHASWGVSEVRLHFCTYVYL